MEATMTDLWLYACIGALILLALVKGIRRLARRLE
jgi:hypothetical protein